MLPDNVEHIFCAVRGVPQSRATVTKAIDLAVEHKAQLTFVHINNADFLISAGPMMNSLSRVKKQIHNLSEFAMLVLCDRAQRQGIEEVDFIIRDGEILPEIFAVLTEYAVDILVVGKPVEPVAGSTLKMSDFETFLYEVENSTNTVVIPVEIEIQ